MQLCSSDYYLNYYFKLNFINNIVIFLFYWHFIRFWTLVIGVYIYIYIVKMLQTVRFSKIELEISNNWTRRIKIKVGGLTSDIIISYLLLFIATGYGTILLTILPHMANDHLARYPRLSLYFDRWVRGASLWKPKIQN